jgi:hypothetical protein
MKHFSIIDFSGIVISDNLEKECKVCFDNNNTSGNLIPNCPKYSGQRRQGKISNNKGITFLCCDTTKTTKLFKNKLEGLSYAYYDLIIPKKQIEDDIKKSEQQKVNRLVHNLTSINAHNIQEIYDLIPQEVLSSNWRTQIEYIENELNRNSKKASMMFLRIAKHNIHMKSEFSIYRKLDRTDAVSLEIRSWSVRNVLLNVLHTFFADFTKNRIYVQVNDFFGKVKFDYETIQVAFYHLIENASKYAKPNSTIDINFIDNPDSITLSIEMISLYINPLEREKIFLEGISGSLAKSIGKSGDGIGMWRIKQMMELNEGTFEIVCGENPEKLKGIQFSENRFNLSFKKY